MYLSTDAELVSGVNETIVVIIIYYYYLTTVITEIDTCFLWEIRPQYDDLHAFKLYPMKDKALVICFVSLPVPQKVILLLLTN